MTTRRPHAPRRTPAEAIEELRACAGRQFDPVVVAALEAALEPEQAPVAATG